MVRNSLASVHAHGHMDVLSQVKSGKCGCTLISNVCVRVCACVDSEWGLANEIVSGQGTSASRRMGHDVHAKVSDQN